MSPGDVFPWHQEQWQHLQSLRLRDRLPHALLICGPGGTGEGAFADALRAALLCCSDGARPCGACRGCRELAAGTHPDEIAVAPPEPGKAIGIDQIRALSSHLGLTSGGSTKVARIEPAEAMTLAAANSLLKSLEEPPGNTVLLLVSERPGRLPATVRSRCQRIGFGLPARDTALEWLRNEGVDSPETWLDRAGGAPLTARALAQSGDDNEAIVAALADAIATGQVTPEAQRMGARIALAEAVPLLITAVEDMIRLKLRPDGPVRLPHHRERLATASRRVDARALFDYRGQASRSLPGPSSALRADIQWQGLLAAAAATNDRKRHRRV